METLITIYIFLSIIGIIVGIVDLCTRPQRFQDAIDEIRTNGGKIKYMNESTGTISYTSKNGKHVTYSVYRGYNSHAR